jgi:hypothetical protein
LFAVLFRLEAAEKSIVVLNAEIVELPVDPWVKIKLPPREKELSLRVTARRVPSLVSNFINLL